MRKFTTLAAVAVAVTAMPIGSSAQEHTAATPTPTPTATATPAPPPTYWERNGCSQGVKQAKYRRALRRVYRFTDAGGNYRAARVTKKARERLERRRKCAYSKKARSNMRRATKERAKSWRFHRKIDRLTPFGEWAIPAYIVMCESGGNYRAWNQSGSDASGAYQFLGSSWRAWGGGRYASAAAYAPPWAQHIVAARYYRAAGTSPWECA